MTVPAVVTLTNGTSAWANQVATDVNNLLASVSALSTIAGVPRYATTAARDAAIPIPAQGNLVYVIAGDDYWYYTGAAWANFMDHPDLISRYLSSTIHAGRWSRSSILACASGATTGVSMTIETEDTDGYLTPTSNVATIPAALGGLYLVTASVTMSAPTASRAFLDLVFAGGSGALPASTPGSVRGPFIGEDQGNVTTMVRLAAGNTVTFNLFHLTGGSLNVTFGWFALKLLGP